MLIVFLALGAINAQGASTDAKALFRAGIQAFNDGNLENARRHLESAAELGLKARSLTYNLGVVYFRLQLYDKAKTTFHQLIPTSQKALAYYNIGLIALARDDTPAASEAFKQVLASEPDENLITLATRQLKRLAPDTQNKPASRLWSGLISLGGGYGNNIALFPDTAPTKLNSGFTEAIAAASGYLYRDGTSGLNSSLKLYSRHYPSEHRFDMQIIQADAGWVERAAPGRINVGVGGDHIWRDQQTRERRGRLFAGLRTRHCPGSQALCSIRVEAMQVFPSSSTEAYGGQMYRLDARYQTEIGQWSGDLKYRAEYNNRDNLKTPDEFFSLSPQRHGIKGTIDYALTPKLTLETGAEFRFSYYRTPHELRIMEARQEIRREDKRYRYALAASYRLTNATSLALDLKHTKNSSNIDRYSYNRQTATLSFAIRL
jgi:hypothetical protein